MHQVKPTSKSQKTVEGAKTKDEETKKINIEDFKLEALDLTLV